ncbi:putative transposase [Paenibacillus sp. PastH-3]|nr:putative transposase [Paenibacillus sp. PastH-4]MDH6441489.1 putative transposase [Paenibacillus sp. PastF-4]MDH6529999.1 putative transposase [Paenibacillus sp. PastH-3]
MKCKGVERDQAAKELIQKVYERYNGIYGYRQIQLFLLQDHGVWMNHKKVLRIMQDLGIRSRIRRKHRCNYASSEGDRVAKNILKRDFKTDAPNQKWVTDITQYRVGEKWLYLSAIKDLFNNEIIAYQMSARNDNELVLRTFQQAWSQQKDVTGLIVHSDQGFQYTSHAYHDMLPKVGARISMSRRGNFMTTPLWRASSRISKRKDSILMISEIWMRHKEKLKITFDFITNIGHNEG